MMEQYNYIALSEFCNNHGISTKFIIELHEFGLLNVVIKKNILYIPFDELPKAEKMVRLHSELDINLEGIEVIHRLLGRIESMQTEINSLKSRLGIYE